MGADILAPVPAHVPPQRVVDVDMYNLDGIAEGYHEAWLKVRKPGMPGLIWTPRCGGHWIATQGSMIKEIYADARRFSNRVVIIPKAAGEACDLVPVGMDPPQHTPYRRALDAALGLGRIRPLDAQVREIAGGLIDGFAGRGRCDFAKDYAQAFPVRVFMALAELPMADVPALMTYARQLTRPRGSTPEDVANDLAAGNRAFNAYADPVVRARRGKSGQDLISLVINSPVDGREMPHDKAVSMVSGLLLGGLDTVVNFLSFVMIHLARNPDIVEQLKQNPLTLLRGAEELFRRFPVSAEGRMVAFDQDYDGVGLREGEMILIPNSFHGLDATIHDRPMQIDFARRELSHSGFGGGPHRCAGLHLARMETLITLQEWLKRIPRFRLTPGTAPVYRSGVVAFVDHVCLEWPV